MQNRPTPVFRSSDEILLCGNMSIYPSQAEASRLIPKQWQTFRLGSLTVDEPVYYGASPCTSDHRIHYLTGVVCKHSENGTDKEQVKIEAGEYAVVYLADTDLLRETWTWLLSDWLQFSGRQERNVPEFERFATLSDNGVPSGPVELWIPLEPLLSE